MGGSTRLIFIPLFRFYFTHMETSSPMTGPIFMPWTCVGITCRYLGIFTNQQRWFGCFGLNCGNISDFLSEWSGFDPCCRRGVSHYLSFLLQRYDLCARFDLYRSTRKSRFSHLLRQRKSAENVHLFDLISPKEWWSEMYIAIIIGIILFTRNIG
jgi:hypothetical protein